MPEFYPQSGLSFRSNLDKVKRSRQIISVFIKFGLDYLLDVSRVNFITKIRSRRKGYEKLSSAERLRLAFEELGPTFIKFGQILSTRPDFLPSDYISELEKLQDKVLPVETLRIRECIEKELNKPLNQVFKEFDEKPVASASLSQVHKAVLYNGEIVALKIQKPGIRNTIELDLSILESFADVLEKRLRNGPFHSPKAVVAEIKKALRKELDFLNEAHNFDKFRNNFKGIDYIKVPKVYWDLTTEKLLTMEFIEGVKISEITQEKYRQQFDLKKIADRAAEALLKQILLDGFFHADPHPGNLFVQPPDTIVMLDVGMTGHLDERTIIIIAKTLRAANEKDYSHIIRGLQDLGLVVQKIDKFSLRQDLDELIELYSDRPFKTISMAKMNQQILEIMMRHKMAIPSNLVMMLRSISIAESVGKQLEPDFDMFSLVQPFVRKIYFKLYSPRRWKERGVNVMDESVELVEHLPHHLSDLLRKLREGQFEVKLEHHKLEEITQEIKGSSNRISASLIIAALIVGSSLILQQGIGPTISNVSIIGIIGYILAGVLGLGLIISIFRLSRKK
ncbi:ABC1 kinase family protein [Anaerorudis cellulosivorans]|mgnify:FL=1|jgi:ubiquinone biosynthesis protein|uniref:ABC1 kinase family protein n=1 Tax=Anaerorudis cellulosivorans TaxID=3397862 RepID=UPI002221037C|nr:AarF/ABC1/UbiB kinase family protein [Seramator thermalis]MCW1736156.1 AarF/ABC1/UbiB kinase family protein [Seramator thermalis]HOV71787.1 AarF/ABC1/UbiB kinase family protein [Dysgonamonadaceae bacterium]